MEVVGIINSVGAEFIKIPPQFYGEGEKFGMTLLGQMLVEKGIEKGMEALILDNLEEKKTEAVIISKLEKRFSLSAEQAKYHYDRLASS